MIPRFIEQIRKGGPVTVTHPEMRRYFMLITEAVQLVLHAAALEGRGDTYILDMGEPVKLLDLARDLIRLSGYIPGEEIAITFVGSRPGEKLSEMLVGDDETAEPSPVDKIQRLRASVPHPLNGRLLVAIAELEEAAAAGREDLVHQHLSALVPTFSPSTDGHRSRHSHKAASAETPPLDTVTHAGELDLEALDRSFSRSIQKSAEATASRRERQGS